jgi:MoaA/NifB/PqqE/SkfB family radical SAM enzyme
MKLNKITACLDLAGCPSRCLHCWLGCMSSGSLTAGDLCFAAEAFRPYAEKIEVFSWCREPDYRKDYRALWALEARLSDEKTPHFELMSLWRAARDESYIPWLRELGVRRMQLTLFGGRETTDRYYGRAGAFDEVLRAIARLRQNGIVPRLQVFVNRENIGEMPGIEALAQETGLAQDPEFRAFAHQGSCDGENEKLYPIRITPQEAARIPPRLRAWTEQYLGRPLEAVFGQTEAALCSEMAESPAVHGGAREEGGAVFYIDQRMDVYPNWTAPGPAWRLGNLRADGAAAILARYLADDTPGQRACARVTEGELVRACGDGRSQRLFTRDDYRMYLINRYARGEGTRA